MAVSWLGVAAAGPSAFSITVLKNTGGHWAPLCVIAPGNVRRTNSRHLQFSEDGSQLLSVWGYLRTVCETHDIPSGTVARTYVVDVDTRYRHVVWTPGQSYLTTERELEGRIPSLEVVDKAADAPWYLVPATRDVGVQGRLSTALFHCNYFQFVPGLGLFAQNGANGNVVMFSSHQYIGNRLGPLRAAWLSVVVRGVERRRRNAVAAAAVAGLRRSKRQRNGRA